SGRSLLQPWQQPQPLPPRAPGTEDHARRGRLPEQLPLQQLLAARRKQRLVSGAVVLPGCQPLRCHGRFAAGEPEGYQSGAALVQYHQAGSHLYRSVTLYYAHDEALREVGEHNGRDYVGIAQSVSWRLSKRHIPFSWLSIQ